MWKINKLGGQKRKGGVGQKIQKLISGEGLLFGTGELELWYIKQV